MTRAVGLFAAALLAASLGVAPDTSTSGTASRQNYASIHTSTSNLNPTTTGCLLASSLGTGSFPLTQNRTGAIYGLPGGPGDRSAQLGDQVAVPRQRMSETPSAAGAEPVSDGFAEPAPRANGDEETSASGSEAGRASSGVSSTGRWRENGDSRIQLATGAIPVLSDPCESFTTPSSGSSSAALLSAADRSTSRRLFAGPGTNSSENASPAESSTDDQASQMAGENLPPTSNLLPLLGLVGVGSLIAGFFMRR
jgi:hypothetical protein